LSEAAELASRRNRWAVCSGDSACKPLDRDPAAESLVLGEEDGGHAAAADALDRPIAPSEKRS